MVVGEQAPWYERDRFGRAGWQGRPATAWPRLMGQGFSSAGAAVYVRFADVVAPAFAMGEGVRGAAWAPRMAKVKKAVAAFRQSAGALTDVRLWGSTSPAVFGGSPSTLVPRAVGLGAAMIMPVSMTASDRGFGRWWGGGRAATGLASPVSSVGKAPMTSMGTPWVRGVRAEGPSFARALVDGGARAVSDRGLGRFGGARMVAAERVRDAMGAVAPAGGDPVAVRQVGFHDGIGLVPKVNRQVSDGGDRAGGERLVASGSAPGDMRSADGLQDVLGAFFERQARLPPASGGAFDPLLTPLWRGQKLSF